MILVDRRDGSKELADLLSNSVIVEMEYGDAAIVGNGPEGAVSIGVERKKVPDLLQSIASGRLAGHQIPGMLNEYYKTYLIVEGLWRGNIYDGGLEVWKHGRWMRENHGRKWRAVDIWGFLTTMEQLGISIRCTSNMAETCQIIEYLYKWWSKPWDKHKSHMAMHSMPIAEHASLVSKTPSLKRMIAKELPKIGSDRSEAVDAYFRSVKEMINAEESEWVKIPGIGKVTAKMVVEAVNKNDKWEENKCVRAQ